MKVYDTTQIRNLAIVGHGHSGKTSLVSALLYATGAVNRLGRVDDGTAVTDSDPEEHERKISIACGLAQFEHGGVKINLVDTPGYGDFIGEARAGIRAADTVVSVVHGVSGPQVQTLRTWRWAEQEGLAGAFVVNLLDRERADFGKVVGSLQETFARGAVPLAIPIGAEHEFVGVVNLLDMKAYLRPAEGAATGKVEAIPAGMEGAAKAARAALVEMVAEADEALMETFFANGDLDDAALRDGLRKSVAARQIFPVFPASAAHVVGIQALLEAIAAVFPSPAALPARIGKHAETGAEIACAADAAAPLALQVFKTISDQFGTLTLARVFSGTLKHDSNVNNASRNTSTRFGHLLALRGREQTAVEEIKAGDIVAAAKLKDVHTGDSLGDKNRPVVFPPIPFPEAIISFAISAKNKGEDEKIAAAIHRLGEEDLTIHFYHHPETGDQLLSGMGTEHVRVTVSKMQKRFGVEAVLRPPRIPYRETIKKKAETTARHKKQTGGHGQFAECKISLEPLPHGGGYEFVDDIFGGSIPRQYIPAVEKGIQDARVRGFLAGFPMVDFRATVFDGSFHQVDSNELSFKMAGQLAFKDAMTRARPTILEPIMQVEVYSPSDFAGDLMGDLNGRRGRIAGMDTRGVMTVIRAQVPMSEMLTYEQHLTSATGGRGSYHMEYSHYEEVPHQLQGKIISAAKAERGQEVAEEV